MPSSTTRRTPGSTSSVAAVESSSSVVTGTGESVAAAGACSIGGVVRTLASRKPPNSPMMMPAATNRSAENTVDPEAGAGGLPRSSAGNGHQRPRWRTCGTWLIARAVMRSASGWAVSVSFSHEPRSCSSCSSFI